MARHVKVHRVAYGFIMSVNLWKADDAHRDTCAFKVVAVRPTRKQSRAFLNGSRPHWRQGARA